MYCVSCILVTTTIEPKKTWRHNTISSESHSNRLYSGFLKRKKLQPKKIYCIYNFCFFSIRLSIKCSHTVRCRHRINGCNSYLSVCSGSSLDYSILYVLCALVRQFYSYSCIKFFFSFIYFLRFGFFASEFRTVAVSWTQFFFWWKFFDYAD